MQLHFIPQFLQLRKCKGQSSVLIVVRMYANHFPLFDSIAVHMPYVMVALTLVNSPLEIVNSFPAIIFMVQKFKGLK